MPTLLELQTRFKNSVLTGNPDSIAPFVQKDRLAPEARLRIHRNQYRTSLAAALTDNFPVTCRLVGKDFFNATAKRYIDANPPAGPCLSAYGASFPDFLARFEPARALAYLPGVARLEWLRIEVSHAPGEPVLDLQALAGLPAATQSALKLRLVPRVRLLASDYPVDRIWLANQEAEMPRVDLSEGGCFMLISYDQQGCRLQRLAAGVHAFFDAAARQETLLQAAECGLAADPAFDLALALATHRSCGALADTIEE
jgi:hypothetical protein